MSKLKDYANKYQTIRFERRNGILQMTLHTEGQSLRWGSCRMASCRRPSTMSAATARIRW